MAKKTIRKVAKHKVAQRVAPTAAPAPSAPAEVSTPTSTPTEPPVIPEVAAKQEPLPEQPAKGHSPGMIGIWAYVIGILVALIAAVFVSSGLNYYTYAALAIIGFLVGLLNITDDEILLFLVASVAFVISAASVRGVISDVPAVTQFLANIIIFTAASAFLVSLKAIIKVAKNE